MPDLPMDLPKKISLVEFLESKPPDTELSVDPLADRNQDGIILAENDIHLTCDSEDCAGKGELQFRYASDNVYLKPETWKFAFTTHVCRNCRKTNKTFALAARLDAEGYSSGTVLKIGEIPPFGPPVPARVISLIGPDRDLFLSGRRAENRGLGIDAFAYYRRVVENQKGRIIEEMAKVARKLEAPEDDLKLFETAAKETKFSAAVDRIKAAIPSALRIDGHNPLTLLHDALSDGLHERSDEE